MFKIFDKVKKFKSIFKVESSNYIEDFTNNILSRNNMRDKVEVNVTYFMPPGRDIYDAYYDVVLGCIYINMNKLSDMDVRSYIIKTYGSIDAYLDCLISHELGHVYDPNFESLLLMMNNTFYSADVRKKALLLSEQNAWIYGRRFTSYPEQYEKFNRLNFQNYQKVSL